jgi:hypothetical protein
MSEINAAVAVLRGTPEVERLIRKLCSSGFSQDKLSIVVRDKKLIQRKSDHFPSPGNKQFNSKEAFFCEGVQNLLSGWGV